MTGNLKNMMADKMFENESFYRLWEIDAMLEIINTSGLRLSFVDSKAGQEENWIKLAKK